MAYPKKAARKDAIRAFIKVAPDAALLEQILAAVRKQAATEQWRKDGGQYVPNAATWLNGSRWEDGTTGGIPMDDIFAGAH